MRRTGVEYKRAEDHPCNLLKAQVDDYAAQVAKALEFQPGDDIYSLISRLGGRICIEDPFGPAPDEDTIWVHGKQDFDIMLSSVSSMRRDRFTLAHELGHYLLHSRQGERPLTANRSGTGRAEWEANWFAAGLLMPKGPFLKLARSRCSISQLADAFGVSQAAATVRQQTLNVQ